MLAGAIWHVCTGPRWRRGGVPAEEHARPEAEPTKCRLKLPIPRDKLSQLTSVKPVYGYHIVHDERRV
jgi:hypothetical protein